MESVNAYVNMESVQAMGLSVDALVQDYRPVDPDGPYPGPGPGPLPPEPCCNPCCLPNPPVPDPIGPKPWENGVLNERIKGIEDNIRDNIIIERQIMQPSLQMKMR
jgi:hypothetical protein